MKTESPQRKLAAIMFIDMMGYTSLMQQDEEKARELIEYQREIVSPLVDNYGGRVLQFVGDGTFCSFESAIESVNCAMEIQKALTDQTMISLRIGIHVGDVVLKGDEVYGDGVNVASRIESLAEPGGICISGRVYDDIRNQRNIEAVFLGEKELKNVDRPIEVYAMKGENLPTPQNGLISTHQKPRRNGNRRLIGLVGSVLLIAIFASVFYMKNFDDKANKSDKKMLVVLPFENLGSAENEYFADGITEEITSRLAEISGLGVISRTSAIQYKNVSKSVAEIGNELGVQYILEGTIRYQPSADGVNQVRITPQLIRVSDDSHLWATTYNELMVEIFDLQTNIAEKVASALDITLLEPEREILNKKHTINLEAYDYYLRGNEYLQRGTKEKNFKEASMWYLRAVELDPGFALAYARLSMSYTNQYWFGNKLKEHSIKAEKAVLKALQLKPNLAEAHLAIGEFQNKAHQDYDEALEHFTIALKSQPNNSDVYAAIALVQKRQGNWDDSIKNYEKAMKLDPLSPLKAMEAGRTYLYMRKYTDAEKIITRAKTLNPYSSNIYTLEAWLYLLWDSDKIRAQKVIAEATEVDVSEVISGEATYLWGKGLWSFDLLKPNDKDAPDLLSKDSFGKDTLTFYLAKAQLYGLKNEEEFEKAYYDSALVILERQIKNNPNRFPTQSVFGFVNAQLGFRDRAIEAGNKAKEIMPISLCHF